MKIHLGENLNLDLPSLVDTRLLIQANSGGGKSWAIRKLLESTHGKVQQIVLDIEGDFPSLREKFDFILAGKGGDIPADPKSAELLARKILELNSDIIIDLYELKQHERIRFVRLFLDAMVNAPKHLWHPALVVLDEAHIFAPEKGHAESMGSVIDICTRGRKRGFCAVLATQRLSKLHKDAAAECNNKLIGRTGLDIDVKRALDELGLVAKSAGTLRDLEPGEFYAFGPAISKQVVKGKIGAIQTKHPKAGSRGLGHTPAPTEKVKAVLAKLTDLPKEAEEELRDREALQTRVRELERAVKQKPAPVMDEDKLKQNIERAIKQDRFDRSGDFVECLTNLKKKVNEAFIEAIGLGKELKSSPKPIAIKMDRPSGARSLPARVKSEAREERSFGACERKILGFLLMKSGQSFTKPQVGAMTGYSHGSGGFNNALSHLAKENLITRQGSSITLNTELEDEAQSIVGNETPHRLEDWVSKLGACERKIYETLLSNPDQIFPKDEIAEQTGYSSGSGGFNNAISRLNTLGLIKRHHGGQIRLNDEVVGL